MTMVAMATCWRRDGSLNGHGDYSSDCCTAVAAAAVVEAAAVIGGVDANINGGNNQHGDAGGDSGEHGGERARRSLLAPKVLAATPNFKIFEVINMPAPMTNPGWKTCLDAFTLTLLHRRRRARRRLRRLHDRRGDLERADDASDVVAHLLLRVEGRVHRGGGGRRRLPGLKGKE